MTQDEKKQLVRQYVEQIINRKNLAMMDDLCAPTMQWHGGSAGDFNADQLKAAMRSLYVVFPDIHAEEEALFAEDDLVATRWTISATHHAPAFGTTPTGKRLVWMGIDIFRVEAGKIVEEWAGDDTMALMQQIGALPGPQ